MRRWHELAQAMERNDVPRKKIASIFGVTEAAVSVALREAGPPPCVPEWVPDQLRTDFIRISYELGEKPAMRWALYWVTQ